MHQPWKVCRQGRAGSNGRIPTIQRRGGEGRRKNKVEVSAGARLFLCGLFSCMKEFTAPQEQGRGRVGGIRELALADGALGGGEAAAGR